jgi:signal transduction histidine kinase/DNA-binding response OmpR family regulator
MWSFRGLALIMIAGGIVGTYVFRTRQFKLAASRLEAQVEQRTHELSVAKDAAEQASRTKSAFLAAMSHELRTPLNAILGFSRLLRQRGASEEQKRDLDIINRSGEHLLTLINDLLDLAKIEAGRDVLHIAPCDLHSLVQDVAEMIRVRAAAEGLALSVEAPAIIPRVRTDTARLRQVLLNLLGNAVKYTDTGGIMLRLDVMPGADAQHVLLSFEVVDTGIGIAPEDHERIFEPFVQVGRAGVHKGTGLGLTITRHLVGMMGGTIQLESAPGKGARFQVAIPAEMAGDSDLPALAEAPEEFGELEPDHPEYRILIVEDEMHNSMLLSRMLEDAGFRAKVAVNGAEGVEMFRQWGPHFIWMDLRMPVMDGIEATRRIRQMDGGRDVKIAALTASRYKSQEDEVLAAGMDGFVLKPYRPAEVFACMAKHLGLRYRRSAAEAPALPSQALTSDTVGVLSEKLREELRAAVLTLDAKQINAAIAKIVEVDPGVGAVLSGYASRFAYTVMLQAVDDGKQTEAANGA